MLSDIIRALTSVHANLDALGVRLFGFSWLFPDPEIRVREINTSELDASAGKLVHIRSACVGVAYMSRDRGDAE